MPGLTPKNKKCNVMDVMDSDRSQVNCPCVCVCVCDIITTMLLWKHCLRSLTHSLLLFDGATTNNTHANGRTAEH